MWASMLSLDSAKGLTYTDRTWAIFLDDTTLKGVNDPFIGHAIIEHQGAAWCWGVDCSDDYDLSTPFLQGKMNCQRPAVLVPNVLLLGPDVQLLWSSILSD